MKKLLILLMAAMFLVACGSQTKGIEVDNELDMQVFSFDEDEFKEKYEENTGKAIPISFEINYSTMSIDNASADQVEGFLKTAHDMLGEEVIEIMYQSFKEDRDELVPGEDDRWRKVEKGDRLFLDYGITEDDKYISSVYLNVKDE